MYREYYIKCIRKSQTKLSNLSFFYYILRKRIPIKGSYRSNYVYAISEKSYVEGWSKVSKRDIKEDEVIATNIEYMEALVNIYDGDITVIKDNSNKIRDEPKVIQTNSGMSQRKIKQIQGCAKGK